MDQLHSSIHVKHDCDFCGETNELTAMDVLASEKVTCSLCGKPLGTVGELASFPPRGEDRETREIAL